MDNFKRTIIFSLLIFALITPAAAQDFLDALRKGDITKVEELLEKNPLLINSVDNTGWTPLHYSVSRNRKEITLFLIQQGADVNLKDNFGRTPMHYALMRNMKEFITLLYENGADITIKDNEGGNAIQSVVKKGDTELVSLFLKNGFDVNKKEEFFGKTLLHMAAINGYREAADLLLKNGALIDLKDNNGRTPVYYANRYGHKNVADLLLECGAKNSEPEDKSDTYSILHKELNDREAVIWYLGHCGWAIKTKSKLLIFDYIDQRNRPDEPSLINGYINPLELKDLDVIVFVSHDHFDHFNKMIFEWKNTIQNITYILGFNSEEQFEYTYLGPRKKIEIDDLKITTIESNDTGVGFLIIRDGLTIYHAGDHFPAPGCKEIEYLANNVNKVDMYFQSIKSGMERNKDLIFTFKKLRARVVFPMHWGGKEQFYQVYADRISTDNKNLQVPCAENKGDMFFYSEGKLHK